MIEPRAWQQENQPEFYAKDYRDEKAGYVIPLTTVADVLAALREPSAAMLSSGFAAAQDKGYVLTTNVTAGIFLAMLDQFERDQGSAT